MKLYNICLFIHLKLDFKFESHEALQKLLAPLNLIPLKFRLFFRFILLSHKILKNKFYSISLTYYSHSLNKLIFRTKILIFILLLLSAQLKVLRESQLFLQP